MTPLQTLLLSYAYVILIILLLLLVAFLFTINSSRIARWLVGVNGLLPGRRTLSDQRRQTLVRLYASAISFFAILVVIIGTLRIFIDPSQIVWIIGLFSAGFGLGARVLVSDLLAGGTYIFRNTFSIGEKAEFIVGMNRVEGIVEDVNMRSTLVRAPSGELYTVPNGEIGIIRNFTRGHFSGAQIKVQVPTESLTLAIQTLSALGEQAMGIFPAQMEPWQVLMTDEMVGKYTMITINVKFTFGNAAPGKPLLAALIYEGLTGAGIEIPE